MKLKLPKIKPLGRRSPFALGLMGTVLLTCVTIVAFQYNKLPFVKNTAYELYPLAVVGIAGALWHERARLRPRLRAIATA